jgi:hypothetical protein
MVVRGWVAWGRGVMGGEGEVRGAGVAQVLVVGWAMGGRGAQTGVEVQVGNRVALVRVVVLVMAVVRVAEGVVGRR